MDRLPQSHSLRLPDTEAAENKHTSLPPRSPANTIPEDEGKQLQEEGKASLLRMPVPRRHWRDVGVGSWKLSWILLSPAFPSPKASLTGGEWLPVLHAPQDQRQQEERGACSHVLLMGFRWSLGVPCGKTDADLDADI